MFKIISNIDCVGKGEIDMKELLEKKRLPLTLDIQHFADDPEGGEGGTDPETPPEGKETFTQSEVDSQISKAVEKALQRKQADFEKQLEDKLAEERKSAEEYAKMTAKEKEEAKYQERLKELEAREKEINSRELLTQIESDLKENELPLSFAASLLSVGNNEKIKESLASIKKDFLAAVDAAVKEKLKGTSPKVRTGGNSAVTKESILDIKDSAERIKAIQDNPHLFN